VQSGRRHRGERFQLQRRYYRVREEHTHRYSPNDGAASDLTLVGFCAARGSSGVPPRPTTQPPPTIVAKLARRGAGFRVAAWWWSTATAPAGRRGRVGEQVARQGHLPCARSAASVR
jgi:hypothetical protein